MKSADSWVGVMGLTEGRDGECGRDEAEARRGGVVAACAVPGVERTSVVIVRLGMVRDVIRVCGWCLFQHMAMLEEESMRARGKEMVMATESVKEPEPRVG